MPVAFLALALALCSGCGTWFCHPTDNPPSRYGVYRGVRFDAAMLKDTDSDPSTKGCSICFAVWDLPFSAIVDTLYLPYDLFHMGPTSRSVAQE